MPGDRPSAKSAAKQATREALLRAATEMLFEAPAADPIGALKAVDVGRRADPPRSTGAFYNIWPTQADFRRDVLHHALAVDRFAVSEPTAQLLYQLLGGETFDLREVLRVAGNLNFDGLQHDSAMRLKQALWSRYETDPEVRELMGRMYEGVTALLVPLYAALLERSGRRMRPPFTVERLGVVLAALAEGLHLRWSVQPEAVPDELVPDELAPDDGDRAERWTLFSSVAYVLVLGMSEPV